MAIAPAHTADSAYDSQIEVLLMRHSNMLHAYLERKIPLRLRRVLSPEDILQEVWFVAAKKLRGIDPSQNVGAWLMRATKFQLADAIKSAVAVKRGGATQLQHNMRPDSSSALDPLAKAASKQLTPSGENAAKEAALAVRSAVLQLPERYREAVTQRYLNGEPVSVVAKRMRRTVPAIRGLLYHGIRILRGHLGPAWRFFSDDGSANIDHGAR